MVEVPKTYRRLHTVFESVERRRDRPIPLRGAATQPPGGIGGGSRFVAAPADPADLDPAAVDALGAALGPAVQAIVGLYLACRLEGERYVECFARLGAPTYGAILHEALHGFAGMAISYPEPAVA
jgi:hypothetical protein